MFEETLLIIKPDAVKSKVVGKIISIIENNNIDIINIKKVLLNRTDVEYFYFEHKNKPFYSELVNFMLSGDVVALILRDIYVISKVRNLVGNVNYKLAEIGTIRQLFASSLTENAVHASDSYESFLRENKIIFKYN
ncbi:MAG TPA: nucleoside-diphosphate kinase [Candidatus Azoamicus sp.]